jgi:hypothetical protein
MSRGGKGFHGAIHHTFEEVLVCNTRSMEKVGKFFVDATEHTTNFYAMIYHQREALRPHDGIVAASEIFVGVSYQATKLLGVICH